MERKGPQAIGNLPLSVYHKNLMQTGQEQSFVNSDLNLSVTSQHQCEELRISPMRPSMGQIPNNKEAPQPFIPNLASTHAISKTNDFLAKKKTGKKSIFLTEFSKIKIVKRAIEKMKQGSSFYLGKLLKKVNLQIIGDVVGQSSLLTMGGKNSNKNTLLQFLRFNKVVKIYKKLPIINPNNRLKLLWDFAIICIILLNIFCFSIEIAFDADLISKLEVKTYIHITFLAFILDFLVKFKTKYYESGILVKNHKSITMNYLKNGFILDFISIFSMMIYIFFCSQTAYKWIILIFFLRANNIKTMIKTFENYIDFGDFFELFCVIFKVVLIAHIYACVWHYISYTSFKDDVKNTWLQEKNLTHANWEERYIYSFYWALTTMVTVGYGDITPQNLAEIIFCAFALLTGSLVFGYFLNRIGSLLTKFDERDKELRQNIKVMDHFMKFHNITGDLKGRTIKYLEFALKQERKNVEKEQYLLDTLPESLRKEILFESNKKSLLQFSILTKNFSEEVINKLSIAIKAIHFSPKEIIYERGDYENDNPSLFLLVDGKVDICQNKRVLQIMEKSHSFGNVEFFSNIPYQETIRSATFCTIYKVPRKLFIEILKQCPEQFEIFCSIKENVTLYNNQHFLNNPCYSCNGLAHSMNDCPLVTFQPKKKQIIAKISFSRPQIRKKANIREIRQKTNALASFTRNWKAAFRLRFNSRIIADFNDKLLLANKNLDISKENIDQSEDKLENNEKIQLQKKQRFGKSFIQSQSLESFRDLVDQKFLDLNAREWKSEEELPNLNRKNNENYMNFLENKQIESEIDFVPSSSSNVLNNLTKIGKSKDFQALSSENQKDLAQKCASDDQLLINELLVELNNSENNMSKSNIFGDLNKIVSSIEVLEGEKDFNQNLKKFEKKPMNFLSKQRSDEKIDLISCENLILNVKDKGFKGKERVPNKRTTLEGNMQKKRKGTYRINTEESIEFEKKKTNNITFKTFKTNVNFHKKNPAKHQKNSAGSLKFKESPDKRKRLALYESGFDEIKEYTKFFPEGNFKAIIKKNLKLIESTSPNLSPLHKNKKSIARRNVVWGKTIIKYSKK